MQKKGRKKVGKKKRKKRVMRRKIKKIIIINFIPLPRNNRMQKNKNKNPNKIISLNCYVIFI